MKIRSKNSKPRVKKEEVKVKSLLEMTDEELIAEGYRKPHRIVPCFKKDAAEREALSKIRKTKGPTGGAAKGVKRTEPLLNLIVHMELTKKYKNTTETFKARASEVSSILYSLLGNRVITKAWYAGNQLELRR